MNDYEKALHYIQTSAWDNLLILMVRTQDNFLTKKIEYFLHAFHYGGSNDIVEANLTQLLQYLDHSVKMTDEQFDFVFHR